MAAFLAAVILMTMSVCQGAFAGETAGIDTARPVSLTIDLEAESKKATISIYKVGEWNGAEGAYALSQEFTGSGADIGDHTATGVLSAAQTLEQFIKNNQIGALSTQATATGKIQFTGLSSGLYLVCQFKASGAFDSIDCQIAGLGGIEDVQKLYVAHTKAAIDSLNG